MGELLETGYEADAIWVTHVRKSVNEGGKEGRIYWESELKALMFVREEICPGCILHEICTKPKGGKFKYRAMAYVPGKQLNEVMKRWYGEKGEKQYSRDQMEEFLKARADCNNLALIYEALGWKVNEEEENG